MKIDMQGLGAKATPMQLGYFAGPGAIASARLRFHENLIFFLLSEITLNICICRYNRNNIQYTHVKTYFRNFVNNFKNLTFMSSAAEPALGKNCLIWSAKRGRLRNQLSPCTHTDPMSAAL